MITERDEFLHTPGTEMPERWQENMMVYGWDLEQDIGFFFHIQRIPHSNITELKAVVCGPRDMVSGRQVIPCHESVMYEGLAIDEPFRKAHLKFEETGVAHETDTALPALSEFGTVPYSIDLALTGKAGPADWFEPLSKMASTETTHYQCAGSFEGTLRYGDRTVRASGLFWRDHTWGNRNYDQQEHDVSDGKGGLHSSWFTPMVFDDGRTFVNGLWIRTTDGHEQQFATLTEGEQTRHFDAYSVEVIDGVQQICEYDSVRVLSGDADRPIDCRLDITRHLPMYLPHHGPSANLSEAFGRATWGNRTGWGSAELMETLPDWTRRPAFADQMAAL